MMLRNRFCGGVRYVCAEPKRAIVREGSEWQAGVAFD